MSTNREHIIWAAGDGTFSIGFYDYNVWGEDHEWDVDYDYSRFWFVSTGHLTTESAWQAYHRYHSNPGHMSVETFYGLSAKETKARVAELNEMAWAFQNPKQAREKARQARLEQVKKERRKSRQQAKDFIRDHNGITVMVEFERKDPEIIGLTTKKEGNLTVRNDRKGVLIDGKFIPLVTGNGALPARIVSITPKPRVQRYGGNYGYGYGRY